jgi:hypothetical protein
MNDAAVPCDDDILRAAKDPNLTTVITLVADGQPQARRRHTCLLYHSTKLSSVVGLVTPAVQAPVTPSRLCHVERGVAPAAWPAGLDRCAT